MVPKSLANQIRQEEQRLRPSRRLAREVEYLGIIETISMESTPCPSCRVPACFKEDEGTPVTFRRTDVAYFRV